MRLLDVAREAFRERVAHHPADHGPSVDEQLTAQREAADQAARKRRDLYRRRVQAVGPGPGSPGEWEGTIQ